MDSNFMNNGRMNACPYRSCYPPRRMEEMRRPEMSCRKEEARQEECSCQMRENRRMEDGRQMRESGRMEDGRQMRENRRMEDGCQMRENRRMEDGCRMKESRQMDDSCRMKEPEKPKCQENTDRMGMGKPEMCEDTDGFALAMGYVPWQFYQDTFDLAKGLQMGTIFPELCKPFCGKRGVCRC